MKTVGIIGGVGPASTVDYYRLLIAAYRERNRDGSYPSIIINSVDLHKMLGFAEAGQLAAMTEYVVAEVHKLARAGADFGLLSSNTPHIIFDEIHRQSPIPLISIVQAVCIAAKNLGTRKLGLLGTRFTMQGNFYPAVFSREGITLVVPDAHDQTYIHDKYMNELVKGIILPATRERLLEIIDGIKAREGIEGVILGGTELPLILRDAGQDIPFLDTAQIHVNAAVEQLLS
jgi:aspartate racemase